MKIIELENIKYSERIIRSLFPNLWSFFLYLFLGIGFSYLFKLDLTDKSFWIILIIYIPIPIYLILIKPYIESKIYITKIELTDDSKVINIDYLNYNLKKQIKIGINDLEYNVFNQVKISLADRIIFYSDKNKTLTQYANSKWDLDKITSVSKGFEKIDIKKPFGFNK